MKGLHRAEAEGTFEMSYMGVIWGYVGIIYRGYTGVIKSLGVRLLLG